jgi:hypothetical protein
MHDALGDAFMVEMRDLLAEVEVLQQAGPTVAGFERMVGVGQSQTLGRGEE